MNTDILYFYSGSSDKLPGKGVNEYVSNINNYKELANIKDWRKILSNFYEFPFIYKEKIYNTVEHAFQSEKIRLMDDKLADTFALDSDSSLSKGSGENARNNRKLVILSKDKLIMWDNIKNKVLRDILYEKFTQCDICKKVLLDTRKAELWHGAPRVAKSRQYDLEHIRSLL